MTLVTESPMKEYRPTITCSVKEGEECSYCRAPRRMRYPSEHTFKTYDEAFEHGRSLARKVYGSSTHTVGVHEREVSHWTKSEPEPTEHDLNEAWGV